MGLQDRLEVGAEFKAAAGDHVSNKESRLGDLQARLKIVYDNYQVSSGYDFRTIDLSDDIKKRRWRNIIIDNPTLVPMLSALKDLLVLLTGLLFEMRASHSDEYNTYMQRKEDIDSLLTAAKTNQSKQQPSS